MWGGNIDYYTELCKQKSISDCVTFTGWVSSEEKTKIFRSSKLFILPSWNEGLPMSMLEAMSFGIPVIVTRVGGIPSVIHNGYNGLMISPKSKEELKNAICRLLNDDAYMKKMSEHAYCTVEKGYSITNNIVLLSGLYKKLLS